MIYFNDTLAVKLKKIKANNYYVVTDFDGTVTLDFKGAWELFESSKLLPQEYLSDYLSYYNKYRPLENNFDISEANRIKILEEWWSEVIALYSKHKITKEQFFNVLNENKIKYRTGAEKFLQNLIINQVPVLVLSAGAGNIIELDLKNKGLLDNKYLHIISNFFRFKNNITNGIKGYIIHGLNKNEANLNKKFLFQIKNKENIFLLGDSINDINMVDKNKRGKAIKIGFCEHENEHNLPIFRKEFDIVCTNRTSFDELTQVLAEKFGFKFL